MIRVWVGIVALALLLTGCGSSGGSAPSSPASTWRPTGVGSTVEVTIVDGATVTVRAGQRVHFAEMPDQVSQPSPDDLSRLTWYGDLRTFLALEPGAVKVAIPNSDRHFDCPNGPCAHPNGTLQMTVLITPGTAPRVPAPIHLAAGATSATIAVGQQLLTPAGTDISTRIDVPNCAIAGGSAVVGVQPCTEEFELLTGRASRSLTVHVTP